MKKDEENESEFNTRNVFKNRKTFKNYVKDGKFKKSWWIFTLKCLAILYLITLGLYIYK